MKAKEELKNIEKQLNKIKTDNLMFTSIILVHVLSVILFTIIAIFFNK